MSKPNRRRIRLPRWPGKKHRDSQSGGRLSARRAGQTQPEIVADAAPELSRGSQAPPPLGRIVKVRREDALLHLDLLACEPTRGERRVLAADVRAAGSAEATPDERAGSQERSWTVTLLLN